MSKDQQQTSHLLDLIKKLVGDAAAWGNAEIELTRSDLKSLMSRYMSGFMLFFISFAILIAAFFTLAQTVIGALANYLHGHVSAGLIVSAALFIVAAAMIFAARHMFLTRAKSKGIIFQSIMTVEDK